MFCFFFFKQKTAYEMSISDWSSDVCSSDLLKCRIRRVDQTELGCRDIADAGIILVAYRAGDVETIDAANAHRRTDDWQADFGLDVGAVLTAREIPAVATAGTEIEHVFAIAPAEPPLDVPAMPPRSERAPGGGEGVET